MQIANLCLGLMRRPPLPYLLRALPEPVAVVLGGVGDGVDRFVTRRRHLVALASLSWVLPLAEAAPLGTQTQAAEVDGQE